jgi:hypothetical protein
MSFIDREISVSIELRLRNICALIHNSSVDPISFEYFNLPIDTWSIGSTVY